jgi:hypothetical protein
VQKQTVSLTLLATLVLLLTVALSTIASAQVPATPPNDNFAAATAIAALPFTATQPSDGATIEPTEPVIPCAIPPSQLNSVWFSYTPAAAGWVTVDTGYSFIDTVLSVWTGKLGALSNVACSDDHYAYTVQSHLTFNAAAGTTYYIMVAGASNETGEITLDVTVGTPPPAPPGNDNFAAATAVTAVPFAGTGTTVGATVEAADPAIPCALPPKPASVWFSYTSAVAGSVTVDTAGSAIDTVLGVWTGTTGALTGAGCNDDFVGMGLASRVVFTAAAAKPYFIEVAGANSEEGAFALNVAFSATPPAPPANDVFANATGVLAGIGDNESATGAAAETNDSVITCATPLAAPRGLSPDPTRCLPAWPTR